LDRLESLYQAYKDRVEFVLVVVRDAGHAVHGLEFMLDRDGWHDRRDRIGWALQKKRLSIPAIMDTPTAEAERAYAAWPERLFVLNPAGRIIHDAGLGMPAGWDFEQVRACLDQELNGWVPMPIFPTVEKDRGI